MSFLGKTLNKIVGHSTSTPKISNSNQSTSPIQSSPLQQYSQFNNIFHRNHQVTFSNQYQQDAELALTHLRKVFYELLHPNANQDITQSEKDEKIYSLLPLFIKVFLNSIYSF